MSVITEILDVCESINFQRSIRTIFQHLESEVDELAVEIVSISQGEDGVIGEAVDVILCAVDIMYKYDPYISEKEIQQVVQRKLAKWQRVYGEKKV